MEYAVNEMEGSGIRVIHVSGEHRRPEDSRKLQELALRIRNEEGAKRFLFDMRDAVIMGGTMGAFETGTAPAKMGLEAGAFRIALVYAGDLSVHKFMENVVVNRGYVLRVFGQMDEAQEWLKGL